MCIRCSQLKWMLSSWVNSYMLVYIYSLPFSHVNDANGILNRKALPLPLLFPCTNYSALIYVYWLIQFVVTMLFVMLSTSPLHAAAAAATAASATTAVAISAHFWLRQFNYHFSFYMTIRSPCARFCFAYSHTNALRPLSQFHLYATGAYVI